MESIFFLSDEQSSIQRTLPKKLYDVGTKPESISAWPTPMCRYHTQTQKNGPEPFSGVRPVFVIVLQRARHLRVTQLYRSAEELQAELEERLRFETLLTDLSARFPRCQRCVRLTTRSSMPWDKLSRHLTWIVAY